MEVRDLLFLGPLDRYRKNKVFPWALVLDLSLAVLTSLNVSVIIASLTNYSFSQFTVFNKLFLNPGVRNRQAQGSDGGLASQYNLFDVGTLTQYLQTTIATYHSINSLSFDHYSFPEANSTLTLYASYLQNVGRRQESDFAHQYQVSESDLGPLSLSTVRTFLDSLDYFYLELPLEHEIPKGIDLAGNCFHWDLRQVYSYAMHGTMTISLVPTVKLCPRALGSFLSAYGWFTVLTLVCAVASFWTAVDSIRGRIGLLAQLRGMENSSLSQLWMQLKIEDKARFFGLWPVLSLLSGILQILGCAAFFFVSLISLDVYFRTVGFGCFFAWVELIQYLSWSPNSYAIINTLKRSFVTLWKYALGILPVFMGFVFLGMALFWKSGNYSSISQAMVKSFAMINGDNLYGIFEPNFEANYLAGYLYMFVFFVLFINAIHNIFISIISDGFSSLRRNPIKRGDEAEFPALPAKPLSRKQFASNISLEKKSKVRFRRLINKRTVTAESSTNLAVSEMNDFLRMIQERLDELGRLARNLDENPVNEERLREKLREIVRKCTGEVNEIERLTPA